MVFHKTLLRDDWFHQQNPFVVSSMSPELTNDLQRFGSLWSCFLSSGIEQNHGDQQHLDKKRLIFITTKYRIIALLNVQGILFNNIAKQEPRPTLF